VNLPTYADVEAAARRLEGHAHRTPVLTSQTLDSTLSAAVFFKCENFQRMGAFKFRGAFNALSCLDAAARARGVIGRVVTYDRYNESREAIAERLAEESGGTVIPPFDHPDVIAGQGTAAAELIAECGPLDSLFVPLGGGGLLAGSLLAAQALLPACKVYGVEPEAGNDGQQSLRQGTIVRIDVPRTIADGAQTQCLGRMTFEIIRGGAADILTATDGELVECMRFLAERMKIVVEPTGCLGLAAALTQRAQLAGRRVGIILSGGNVDAARFAALLGADSF
jgi:threonine dehydratase